MIAIVGAAGGTANNVCRLTAYVADIASWDAVNAACEKFFGDHRPARAIIPTGVLRFGYAVAFDAVARVGASPGLPTTADLCDMHRDEIQVIAPGLQSYGKATFAGIVETVRVQEDNSLVRKVLSEPGEGRVLVVDGGGIPAAVIGDNLASIAIASGWSGVVVNGYVRDTSTLGEFPLGVLALGSIPRRSFARAEAERGVEVNVYGRVVHHWCLALR